MKDSDWKILYELHKNPNMTKVAALLYLTQPSLTKRLKAIEEEFEVEIVRRTSSGLSFTKEGDYLAERAGVHLQFLEETQKKLAELKNEQKAVITIGSSYTFSKFALTEVLFEYQKLYPQISFHVTNETSDLLFRRVLDGTADVAFIRGDYDGAFNRVLISRNQAFLMTKEPVDFSALPDMQRIGYSTSSHSRAILDAWWTNRFHTDPPHELSVGHIDFAWKAIKKNGGYTCCFLPHCFENELDLTITPLVMSDGTPVMRNTWFIYPKTKRLDEKLQQFVDYIVKEMAL